MDKPKLSFKPLSSGLGFHPFSDGMPYAPVTKAASTSSKPAAPAPRSRETTLPVFQTPKPAAPAMPPLSQMTIPSRPAFATSLSGPQAPSGANAAGIPRYARVSVPVATPSAPLNSPLILKAGPGAGLKQADELDEDQDLLGVGETYGVAYLFKRVLAYSLDTTINLGLCAAAMMASLWKQGMNPELFWNPGVMLLVALFLTAFNWAVITAQEVAFGTTVGKRVFGLAIDGSTSQVFLRSLFFLVSAGFCGVGLFWAVANPRKRCWHDLVVDLQPIEIASL